MKYSTNSPTLLLVVLISVLAVSCDLFDASNLDETPPHLMTGETMYTDYSGFQAGLNGLYHLARTERSVSTWSHMMTGSMFMLGTDNQATNQFNPGFYLIAQHWGDHNNASHEEIEFAFSWLYQMVNSANTIIQYAERDDIEIDWSGGSFSADENKNIILAEAHALRAWAYRHLTFGWGDVPLALEPSSGATIRTDWTRTPVNEVREQIVADLEFAEQYIPVEPINPGRLTKGAVQHYLAEMALVNDDPETALTWADAVINNSAYQLITERYGVRANQPGVPFMDMHYDGNTNRDEGNTESLWTFQYGYDMTGAGEGISRRYHLTRYWNISIDGVNPFQITHERGGQGYGRGSITKFALELYEQQDDRFSEHAMRTFFVLKDAEANAPFAADRLPPGYAYGDTVRLDWSEDISPTNRTTPNWPYSRKPEGANPGNVLSVNNHNDVYLRLADTYMLKAEAQYLLGNEAGAAETINVIRRRSNASEITASDVDIDFILDERSRELFLEEHRRWTLLRTGKLVERTRAYNNNGGQFITERDELFPIPQSVIDTNLGEDFPQNPGF
ncbi:RagB/SusD family nutrient uptake outer membrane protein [Rhodohalobacter sp. SW132]|uniref:RagB/SusD family nutrient uptake outer membrane protein n=1 Tax=Rhodohalobacter sp. SW132 TaxID=2293433 RepID=UPI000E24CA73|nr:RagB/SusD family nutrient uptake outer membrane protein [Rhodohalobacter sp. SW132]REL32947.1 RagB/SusD family nutrient uptake outer membrane protein [Rhodohalobacter sp. SW132]